MYQQANDTEAMNTAAAALTEKLDVNRKARWQETVADIDFTHHLARRGARLTA